MIMGRLAKKLTLEEFKTILLEKNCLREINNSGELNVYLEGFTAKVEKDLSKIIFNLENTASSNSNYRTGCKLGLHYENEFPFLLCIGGGDWEHGVAFILYIDNKNVLRAYVPEDGNVYNKKYKCAYGSEGEYVDVEPEDEELYEEGIDFDSLPKFDHDKLIADILNRIKVEK